MNLVRYLKAKQIMHMFIICLHPLGDVNKNWKIACDFCFASCKTEGLPGLINDVYAIVKDSRENEKDEELKQLIEKLNGDIERLEIQIPEGNEDYPSAQIESSHESAVTDDNVTEKNTEEENIEIEENNETE